jgi:hypothetical protein
MLYAFVNPSGNIIRRQNFAEMPGQPAPSKGRWMLDAPPPFNPDIETLSPIVPIPANATQVPYTKVPLPVETVSAIAAEKKLNDEIAALENHAFINSLMVMTETQFDAYIDANAGNLVDMKALLKLIIRAVALSIKARRRNI